MSDLNSKHNRVVWCDIPVDDLDRACAFYAGVLGIEVNQESFGEIKFAVLAHDEGNGACLIPRHGASEASPAGGGPMIYLNVDGRIRDAVEKVTQLGGKVTTEVHPIGPHGFRALIEDSEGNAMAIHSNSDA